VLTDEPGPSTPLHRQPAFRRIFCAQAVSLFGDAVAPIAVAFAVLERTGSGADLGLVLAARALPMAAFLLLGGVWADRLPRRAVMVVSDVSRLVTQGAFALVLLQGHSPLWLLMLLQAGNGTATAFFRPAASGLLQEAVPVTDRQRSNALLSAATNTSALAGPAIAALIIALASPAAALFVDAGSFAVSALFLIRVQIPPRVPPVRTGIGRELVEGFRAVRDIPWVGLEILAFCQFQLFVLAPYSVLGPVISQRQYDGASTWAAVTVAAGAGALLGDALALRWRPVRPMFAANAVVLGALPVLLALAAGSPTWLLVATGAGFGLSLSLPNVYWFTALQAHVPDHLMSRVSALDWMGSMILRPLGLALVAPLALAAGTELVLVGCTVLTAITFVGMLTAPSIRQLTIIQPTPRDVR
jgi:predicted MFS family arabinose efflux permease